MTSIFNTIKRFAENIGKTLDACSAGATDDAMYGSHCMDEAYRTSTGGGSFDPRQGCNKRFHGKFAKTENLP